MTEDQDLLVRLHLNWPYVLQTHAQSHVARSHNSLNDEVDEDLRLGNNLFRLQGPTRSVICVKEFIGFG